MVRSGSCDDDETARRSEDDERGATRRRQVANLRMQVANLQSEDPEEAGEGCSPARRAGKRPRSQ